MEKQAENQAAQKDAPSEDEIKIEFPSNILLNAERKCGKSSMCLSLISMYDFDNIIVVSLTPENGNFDKVATVVLPSCSEKFLQDLIELHSDDPKMKTLILFDDFVGIESKGGWNPKTSGAVKEIASSGRHKNISMIFSSQDLMSIPTVFRRLAEYIFLGCNKEEENQKCAKMFAYGSMTKRKLLDELNDLSGSNKKEFILLDRNTKTWHTVEPFIRA